MADRECRESLVPAYVLAVTPRRDFPTLCEKVEW
jgi:hypothetical protein